MISKGKTVSEKKWNEDVYHASNTCIFVIDAATGLSNNQVMSQDDAWWFSSRLKEEIKKRLDLDLLEALKFSILQLQKEYKIDIDQMLKQDMPSGCLSLFRENEDIIEYIGIGDCVGMIELKDGTTEWMIDDRIEKMDGAVIEKMKELSNEMDIPFLSTRPYVNPILLKNRNLRNQEYYALDLTLDWVDGVVYKSWKKEDVKRMACMSDGLFQIFSFTDLLIKEGLDRMEKDLDGLFDQLYSYQEQDAACQLVPRLKKRDDTTGVFAKIL